MEILKSLERLKEETMKRLYEHELLGSDELGLHQNQPATYKKIAVNNYNVFQFSFVGLLPWYKNDDREYLSFVRNYYHRVTNESFDFTNTVQLSKACIIIYHYFQDGCIRDLDNRNRKVIIDAIRHTNLIKDDCWKYVSILEEGFSDKQNHVQVYVLDRVNLPNFLSYLGKHHREVKGNNLKQLQQNSMEKTNHFQVDGTSEIWK